MNIARRKPLKPRHASAENVGSPVPQRFEVWVEDNFHSSSDKPVRRLTAASPTYAGARVLAQRIVDMSLHENFRSGMTAAQLYLGYMLFGDDAFILPDRRPGFSAWAYARRRSVSLTNPRSAQKGQHSKAR